MKYMVIENYPEAMLIIVIISLLFIPLIRFLSSRLLKKREIEIKQIDLMNQVIKANIIQPSKKQKYITILAFESVYRCSFTYDDLKVLLNADHPSRAFKYYAKGGAYLKLAPLNKSYEILEEFQASFTIGSKKVFYRSFKILFNYIFLMLLGGGLLAASAYLYQVRQDVLFKMVLPVMLVFSAFILFIMAITTLWRSDEIKFADRLVNELKNKN